MTRAPKVVIVGAGMGGLVVAAELAAAGLRVTLVEKAPEIGGKIRQVTMGDRAIDAGPTVLTMAWVFEEIFAALGESLRERVSLRRAEIIARHAFADGSRLDLFAEEDRSREAIAAFAGAREAEGYVRFCAYARRIYEACEGPFIRGARPDLGAILTRLPLGQIWQLSRVDARRSMWQALQGFFRDLRLRQLFGRYATYAGSSPFLAPATLNLIAHVEREGVWYVEGGLGRLAEAMATLARERGAEIRLRAEVEEILVESGRARGVRLASGETLRADRVVVNADVAALGSGLLGAAAARAVAPLKAQRRSLSALTIATVEPTTGFPLVHHNVFFSNDYAAEFRDIFTKARLPAQPTVYVCAQDRSDRPQVVDGPERLFLIINAPAVGDRRRFSDQEIDTCTQSAFHLLARAGLRLRGEPRARVVTTPADFATAFPGSGGAIYGAATHGWFASMTRPASRSRVRHLYLAGGSAHPGAGVPMAALSGRQAAGALLADLPSTSASPRTGTPGGTWTGSATMGSGGSRSSSLSAASFLPRTPGRAASRAKPIL